MEARLGGGKCGGELRVVFAEVVCREEEVVEVGFGEPIAERAPNAAFSESGYEAKFLLKRHTLIRVRAPPCGPFGRLHSQSGPLRKIRFLRCILWVRLPTPYSLSLLGLV